MPEQVTPILTVLKSNGLNIIRFTDTSIMSRVLQPLADALGGDVLLVTPTDTRLVIAGSSQAAPATPAAPAPKPPKPPRASKLTPPAVPSTNGEQFVPVEEAPALPGRGLLEHADEEIPDEPDPMEAAMALADENATETEEAAVGACRRCGGVNNRHRMVVSLDSEGVERKVPCPVSVSRLSAKQRREVTSAQAPAFKTVQTTNSAPRRK